MSLELNKKTFFRGAGRSALALFLFAAAAVVVVWQNSRVGVLWDLSYILENSYRMSLGDVPYRDFPFPYAPLTFLTQAAVIRLTGTVFWHHIVYCAVIGGMASLLTWRILLRLVEGFGGGPMFAALLAIPSTLLGVYAVFPHPFYDSDCTFIILLCILLLFRLERKNFPPVYSILGGALLVVPLFIKQNTGLAFLVSACAGLVVLTAVNLWKRLPVKGYLLVGGGIFAGLAAALLIIQTLAGLDNYWHWTITFAASRRTPSAGEMLAVYADWTLWLSLLVFGAGAFCFHFGRSKKWLSVLACALMLAPFFWPTVYLFLDADKSERADRFIGLWPFLIVISFILALLNIRRRAGLRLVLPFVIIGTIHGAFLSQQLWGSTYALWPLLLCLAASVIADFYQWFEIESVAPAVASGGIFVIALLIPGAFYVLSNERLEYINLTDGDMETSRLAPLNGLNVRGTYLPDFEELVTWTDANVPREDGILMIPGEDLFYYTTNRRPQFPVLMFDHTVNPFSSDEIVNEARARNIRWLVVKTDLQLDDDPTEDKPHLMELLKQDFKHVDDLNSYEVYRRRLPGEVDGPDDAKDDDAKDDGGSSDDENGDDESDD
jgi:hypothetical protein